jgi:hypothetical protein
VAKQKNRPKMRFRDALDIVDIMDDDMSDGAYFAMAEEISGMNLCDGVDQMQREGSALEKKHQCNQCNRGFTTPQGLAEHSRVKHGAIQ